MIKVNRQQYFFAKFYEVSRDFEASDLIENGYEKDDYLFDCYKRDKKSTKTKNLYESITIETVKDNKQSILNRLSETNGLQQRGFYR